MAVASRSMWDLVLRTSSQWQLASRSRLMWWQLLASRLSWLVPSILELRSAWLLYWVLGGRNLRWSNRRRTDGKCSGRRLM